MLAGGLSRRMGGGDKTLRLLGGRPILDHMLERVRPQVGASGRSTPMATLRASPPIGLPVVPDLVPDYRRPAGRRAGRAGLGGGAMRPAPGGSRPSRPTRRSSRPIWWNGCSPPSSMKAPTWPAPAPVARSIPVFGLWPVHLRHDLRRAMVEEQIRKVDVWTARYRLAIVDFDADPVDPFFNTNRPDDLAEAERLLSGEVSSS